jgi:hypothetical protein
LYLVRLMRNYLDYREHTVSLSNSFLSQLRKEMEAAKTLADGFLKRRLELVGAIDKQEFEWKKKKKQFQDEMAVLLNKHTIHQDEYKKLKAQIDAAEDDIRKQKIKEVNDEFARRASS